MRMKNVKITYPDGTFSIRSLTDELNTVNSER